MLPVASERQVIAIGGKLYSAEGYCTHTAADAYTLSNLNAKREADGSMAIQFGDCDGRIANGLCILARVELHKTWAFPPARPVN